jgi:hypothetical protein
MAITATNAKRFMMFLDSNLIQRAEIEMGMHLIGSDSFSPTLLFQVGEFKWRSPTNCGGGITIHN